MLAVSWTDLLGAVLQEAVEDLLSLRDEVIVAWSGSGQAVAGPGLFPKSEPSRRDGMIRVLCIVRGP
jgi:hypothetical protein